MLPMGSLRVVYFTVPISRLVAARKKCRDSSCVLEVFVLLLPFVGVVRGWYRRYMHRR